MLDDIESLLESASTHIENQVILSMGFNERSQGRRISPFLPGILRPLRTCNAKAQNDGVGLLANRFFFT